MAELPAEDAIAQRMLQEGVETLLADNGAKIAIVATAVNNYLAKTIKKNGRLLTRIGDVVLNSIAQKTVDNDNRIDLVRTAILGAISDKIDTSKAQLDYIAGLTGQPGPGDPVVLAAAQAVNEMPELAVSSAIGLELSRMTELMEELVDVLADIRDRLPFEPIRFPGELPAAKEKDEIEIVPQDAAIEPEQAPVGPW